MRHWVEYFSSQHEGSHNAYRTLYLGAGADATVVGKDLQQLEFKQTQGAGETRIAAAAGVPPVIVGLSEGLQAATYSNYGQARRRFADGTMSPLWRNAAASLARIIDVPSDAELWYDARDIPFLKEDLKDAAEIQGMEAQTIRTLVDAGFIPETVVEAVVAGEFNRLEHSRLFSVQLQPPMPDQPEPDSGDGEPIVPSTNGNGAGRQLELLDVLDLVDRARPEPASAPDVRVEINEGAFRNEITVPPAPPSRVEIADGAVRNEITVEPARVEFPSDLVRVEPAQVTFREGAVQVHNQPPAVTVDAPITVEPATVEIADGAVRAEITVEAADVHVPAAQIDVHVPEQAPPDVNATVEAGRAEPIPAPVVNVTVDPPPVTVNVPEQQPPDVTVNVEQPRRKVTFRRDGAGDIVEAVTEDEADA
jgi:hypothetical protein